MKQLATFRYLLFVLLFASASACGGDNEKQYAPQPKPTTHAAGLHLVGAGLANLGARVSGGTTNAEGADPQQTFSFALSQAGINEYVTLPDKVSSEREFYTTISFENVRGTFRAPDDSFLVAELLVDGFVKKTIRIDYRTAPGAAYVTARAVIRTSDWY